MKRWFLRIALYVVGLFFLAFGVSLSIKSGLGVSPVSSVPLVLGYVTGIEIGNMTIIIFCFYVIVQIVLLKKQFRWVNLLQIVCAVLFGKFVTLTCSILIGWNPTVYFERLLMVLGSTVVIALGMKLYLSTGIIPQAADGLVQTVSDKYGFALSNVKNCFDILSVLFSVSLSLIMTGKMIGIREGTVITALGVGRVLAGLNYFLKNVHD
jgi:uncharacterized membrane protein YczE